MRKILVTLILVLLAANGQALAAEIPGARLLPLRGAGHGVRPADWDAITRAIVLHTATGSRAGSEAPRVVG